MNADFSSSSNEDDLRSENDFLKMKIMLEQGGQFSCTGDRDIPPEIENEFLKSILEYETKFEHSTYVTVFDKIDRPTHFKPVAEIKEDDMPAAWEELFDYLSKHGIMLDACSPNVTARELYRFTIEELFGEEIEDLDIPGMMQCFIYDIFHPDIVFENTRLAKEECIEYILDKIPLRDNYNFKKENLQLNDYRLLSMEEFARIVNRFKEAYDDLEIDKVQETVCVVNENESWVTGIYRVIATSGREVYELSGKWKVDYEKDDHLGYWYINGVTIEGISF